MWWRRQRVGRDLLRPYEEAVIDAVLGAVSREAAEMIERQLAARGRVSRILGDSDVMLYPASGTWTDPALAFANRSLDLRLATVRIRGPRGTGNVKVTAVDGWLFMLEFRPAPGKVGSSREIGVIGATIHVDPLVADDSVSTRLADLDWTVRVELEQVLARKPEWAASLSAPEEMYTINLDAGEFMVLAQLPDTDFVVARLDPAGPGIRRYDTDGDLIGEYATVQEALQGGQRA
jgi:hypothetical protein